jgi:hypothetical protein
MPIGALSIYVFLATGKVWLWVLKDEISHCVRNDKGGALGAINEAIKHGWLILHCVQDDKGGLGPEYCLLGHKEQEGTPRLRASGAA